MLDGAWHTGNARNIPDLIVEMCSLWSTHAFTSLRFPTVYLFFKKITFIYLFMAVLGLRCCWGFSLVAAGGAAL